MPIKVGILSIFTPSDVMVLFSSRNLRNKGYAKIKDRFFHRKLISN